MMTVKSVGPEELQLCPAAVEIYPDGDAVLLVNELSFPTASPFAQKFYLAHELGHYLVAGENEEAADAFAVSLLAGTERKSLKKSLRALYDLQVIPYERLESLYNICKQIDKQHQKTSIMVKKQNLNYRADGVTIEAPTEPATVETPSTPATTAIQAANVLGDIIGGNNRRRAGIRINNVFFSIESILMAAILIAVVVLCCKK